MKIKTAIVAFSLSFVFTVNATVDLTLTGACNDGSRLVTAELQALIDRVSREGGGKAIIPKGTYKTGTIYLKNNVDLHLSEGATLLASGDLADYNQLDAYPQNYDVRFEGWQGKHLIICYQQTNVAITGKGTIDGNGRAFFGPPSPGNSDYVWRKGYANAKDFKNAVRPGQMIAIIETSNVRIEGFNIVDSPCWTCFCHGCLYVNIGKLKIRSPLHNANTDGIDIDCCRFVNVGDCDIETGDDVIAIRGDKDPLLNGIGVCEHIMVSNIWGACSADGVRLGIGNGMIKDVHFKNLRFREAGRVITITTSYPAGKATFVGIADVSFDGVWCNDCGHAILISGGNRKSDRELSGMIFRNLSIATTGGIVIEGAGKTRPTNILVDNMELLTLPLANPKGHPDWETLGMARTNLAVVSVESADNVRFCNLSIKPQSGEGQRRTEQFAIRDAKVNASECNVIPKPRECKMTGGF